MGDKEIECLYESDDKRNFDKPQPLITEDDQDSLETPKNKNSKKSQSKIAPQEFFEEFPKVDPETVSKDPFVGLEKEASVEGDQGLPGLVLDSPVKVMSSQKEGG